MNNPSSKTLGELKKSGYKFLSIKDELRENLISKLKNKAPIFNGIFGYEETVIPEIERAILSRHNILFLGLVHSNFYTTTLSLNVSISGICNKLF